MNFGLLSASKNNRQQDFDYFMYAVGLIQPFALLPQIITIYVNHNTSGVSFATWALFTGFNALWAVYGFQHRDKPLILAYTLIAIFDAAIAFGVLYY